MMLRATASVVFVLLLVLQHSNTIIVPPGSSVIIAHAFTILHHGRHQTIISVVSPPFSKTTTTTTTTTALSVARYGPQPPLSSPVPENDSNNDSIINNDDGISASSSSSSSSSSASEVESDWNVKVNQQKDAFRRLIDEAMDVTRGQNPETHLPRLLANNLELIVGLIGGQEGVEVINELLDDATTKGGKDLHDQTLQVIETILSFSEMFVEQAQEMDSQNKHLLGKIIKAMGSAKREVVDDDKDSQSVGDVWGSHDSPSSEFGDGNDDPKSREERLDAILEQERDNFTPGFLKHLEGECNRIANAPQMTPESARLLELMRVIQTRVLEEVGKDLGEAALVLGQLMGYENKEELLGVLEAGLTVRGRDFGLEMKQHTEEALDGFMKVPGGVDPELVDRVTLVDKRLQRFLDDTNEFQ